MLRRIELISGISAATFEELLRGAGQRGQLVDRTLTRFWKRGLVGYGNEAVMAAWSQLRAPLNIMR